MRRLPPLTGIEAFVQVARLGSLKAAAEVLALMQRHPQRVQDEVGAHVLGDGVPGQPSGVQVDHGGQVQEATFPDG